MRALVLLLTLIGTVSAAHQDPPHPPARTQVVLLGTGSPPADPDCLDVY